MPLSPQEKKLFFYLITSTRAKEIARVMKIHQSTLDTYAKSIYKKLECENRYDLLIRYYSKEKSLVEAMTLRGI
jgi:DNA-binding CsgD family transcriptional regulator